MDKWSFLTPTWLLASSKTNQKCDLKKIDATIAFFLQNYVSMPNFSFQLSFYCKIQILTLQIVISLQHVFSPVNLLDILRTLFPKNTSRRLLLHLGPDLPMVKLLNECLGANNLRTYLAYAAENSCLKYVRIGFLLTRILQYSHIPYPMKNVRFLEKS